MTDALDNRSAESLPQSARLDLAKVSTLGAFEKLKAEYLGPNGLIKGYVQGIREIPAQERKAYGQWLNTIKDTVEALFNEKRLTLEEQSLAEKLGKFIDPTLPCPEPLSGGLHPLTQIRRKITHIFRKIGFTVATGPEVETEWFCFDALNTPETHPARAPQDTLYFPEKTIFSNIDKKGQERYVLRTQTSCVQIRTLLKEKPPLRIISPGRCFRRDTVDATHSANFHQIEGLYIDRTVTIKDLKATLDYFIEAFFGSQAKTRLRPSFFPFTEPSFELDMRSSNIGKLSDTWIELLGCGLVDPEVLRAVNLDPQEWSGFAFGMGLERIAMLAYGIDDIRHFYQNDLRFLKQF